MRYRHKLPHNCLANSAWHTWQKAGREWRKANPNGNAMSVSIDYGLLSGHQNAVDARTQAFREGAAIL
jgi:hypothetical protein